MSDSDTRPIYLQLRDKIAAAIIDGRYGEGEMLPSVRAFAAQEGANPLTVAKAYQQFQQDGQVEVRRRPGSLPRTRNCASASSARSGPRSAHGSTGSASRWTICSRQADLSAPSGKIPSPLRRRARSGTEVDNIS